MSTVELRAFCAGWSLQQIAAARAVTCSISAGSWVGIVGANGVGKSTFLKGLSGSAPLVRGDFLIDEAPIVDLTDRFRAGVVMVSQSSPWRDGSLAIGEAANVALAERPALQNSAAIDECILQIKNLGWTNEAYLSPRLFDLAAAILSVPEVLLLDEIMPALPEKTGATRYHEIKTLLPGTTCFFVDHDIRSVLEVAHFIIDMFGNSTRALVYPNDDACRARLLEGDVVDVADVSPGRHAWIHAIRLDRSVRQQVQLAIHASQGYGWKRRRYFRELITRFPFLDTPRNAEILSGGQQTILAFILAKIGMHEDIPAAALLHLDNVNRDAIAWLVQQDLA